MMHTPRLKLLGAFFVDSRVLHRLEAVKSVFVWALEAVDCGSAKRMFN